MPGRRGTPCRSCTRARSSRPTSSSPRGRATDFEHYPPEKIAFHMRTPAWCRQQAEKIGPADRRGDRRADGGQRPAPAPVRAGHHRPRRPARCREHPAGSGVRPGAAVGDPSYRTIKGILAAGTETPTAAPQQPPPTNAPAFLRGPDELLA